MSTVYLQFSSCSLKQKTVRDLVDNLVEYSKAQPLPGSGAQVLVLLRQVQRQTVEGGAVCRTARYLLRGVAALTDRLELLRVKRANVHYITAFLYVCPQGDID